MHMHMHAQQNADRHTSREFVNSRPPRPITAMTICRVGVMSCAGEDCSAHMTGGRCGAAYGSFHIAST